MLLELRSCLKDFWQNDSSKYLSLSAILILLSNVKKKIAKVKTLNQPNESIVDFVTLLLSFF